MLESVRFPSLSGVVSLCSAANFINSADRVIMPIALLKLSSEYNYDLRQQGWILSAFPLGYISSQLVGSCAGAQFGGKRLLLFVVFMWSLSTFATPFVASSYHLLLIARVILGLGEGLGLPTIYHIFAQTVAVDQRSRAFGYLNALGSVGQTVAAAVTPHFPWPTMFYSFGTMGFIWCLLWMKFYSELPLKADQLLCNKAPNPIYRLRSFFTSWSLWSIYAAHFCMNWTSYIIMNWLPTYLHRTMDANPSDLSLACLPYVFNSGFSIMVGHLADQLVSNEHISLLRVRKLMTVVGLIGPAVLMFWFSAISHLYVAVVLISICMGLLAFNAAGHLSNHADICPKYAGISFAIANTIATIPGLIVGPLTAELVTESGGRWFPVFILAGCLNFVGSVIYAGHASATQIPTLQ